MNLGVRRQSPCSHRDVSDQVQGLWWPHGILPEQVPGNTVTVPTQALICYTLFEASGMPGRA